MIKVVVDTNVVISALLKANSIPALIVSLILQKQLRLCLSDDIFTEYRDVLDRYKFKDLDQSSVMELLNQLKKQALWVMPQVPVDVIKRDPSDNKFLECALESKADYLVTGNTEHFPFEKFHKTRIVTPRELINFITKIIIK